MARSIVVEKMNVLIEKFPDLQHHAIYLTLSMDNSASQAGPDEFGIRVQIKGKKFDGLIVEKKAQSLYLAMAVVDEVLLELLNRRIDKRRVKNRNQLRKQKYSTFEEDDQQAS